MREDLPLITVIITTYNRVNLLEKAILSVIRQTYKNLEIIISDNHSEDGTEELCKKYAKTDSRIKYFRQEKNIGMPANTNFAHSKSNGEYTHVLCDDDWLDEDFIEKSYEEIRKNPEFNYICPTVKLYDGDNNFLSEAKKINLSCSKISDRIKNYVYAAKNHSSITNGLMKNDVTKAMLEEDGYAIGYRFAEDWVYVVKYLIAGKCKMISTTHYNKLNNGYTTNLKNMTELWNDPTLTYENFYQNVLKTIQNSINNDNFCKNRLNEKERKECCKKAEQGLLTKHGSHNIRNLLKFLKGYFTIRY